MNVCVREYCEGMRKFNLVLLNVYKDWFFCVFIWFGDLWFKILKELFCLVVGKFN